MDLKKAAVTGAVVGAFASLLFGKKGRGKGFEKATTYAAGGAALAALGLFVMDKTGHHVAGELTGWGNEHEFGNPRHSPMNFGHGGAWGNPEDCRFGRRF